MVAQGAGEGRLTDDISRQTDARGIEPGIDAHRGVFLPRQHRLQRLVLDAHVAERLGQPLAILPGDEGDGLSAVARKAVGQAGLVTTDMVKVGAAVLDVGMNRTDDGLVGDVDPSAAERAAFITPVPGGVGPMTIAMLLGNTVRAARFRRKLLAFPGFRR